MSWRNPNWKYTPAAKMKPGYLRDKFRKMQNAMEQPKPSIPKPRIVVRKAA